MEKQQVIVKREKAATRCEICHQTDFFNPITEECLRCSNVEKDFMVNSKITTSLWSPRFALLETQSEEQNSNNRRQLVAITLNVILALVCLSAGLWIGVVIPLVNVIVAIAKLIKQYSKQFNFSNLQEPDSQQITTLFDRYPNQQEHRTYYNWPNNNREITTLFGSVKRKNKPY
ncbi:MAG: hypothetical protein IPK14_26630 [Blastocatellia bacterium]|nr:hypothetical protein [Blastocatellia bacterium]MBL8193566.1 hypothetical protein [Blastocatellia bacterium]MBN8723563.1 hypothetical protein [Acidobacteriota bacterium]